MKNSEQQFSEDLMIIQPSTSVSDSIPVDLLIDIFSRVPAKSIARFRCVSKFWESILGRRDFKDFFLTKSAARPRLFFILEVNKELFFFSSPQPQNPDENTSLVATPYKGFPKCSLFESYKPLYGLVFLKKQRGRALGICNPVTGESIALPKVRGRGTRSFFGFDPIRKQFKVLCTTLSSYGIPSTPQTPNIHQVLTLETGKLSWRPIQDPLLVHYSNASDGIYMYGVVYYRAYFVKSIWIMCFDFRSERLSLINMDKDMLIDQYFTLFNYEGKLGAHVHLNPPSSYYEKTVLWVLDDAGKHKWSKRICIVVPPSGMVPPFGDKLPDMSNDFVGMTGTGELVFAAYIRKRKFKSFHIFYYNIERKIFTKVNIQGFEEFEHLGFSLFTFLDYVENMKLM